MLSTSSMARAMGLAISAARDSSMLSRLLSGAFARCNPAKSRGPDRDRRASSAARPRARAIAVLLSTKNELLGAVLWLFYRPNSSAIAHFCCFIQVSVLFCQYAASVAENTRIVVRASHWRLWPGLARVHETPGRPGQGPGEPGQLPGTYQPNLRPFPGLARLHHRPPRASLARVRGGVRASLARVVSSVRVTRPGPILARK